MSAENVETVRRLIDSFRGGDLETALAAFDPEVEFDVTVRPDGRVFHGHDGLLEGVSSWTGSWEDWKLDTEELVDAGDKVLSITRESARGTASGVTIDHQVFSVLTFRDGKIVHWKVYLDRDEALADAGLPS